MKPVLGIISKRCGERPLRNRKGLRLCSNPAHQELSVSVIGLFTVFFTEFVDSSSGVDYPLFTGIERVACGAYLDLKILTQYGPGFEGIAATTSDCDLFVFWMNVWFHVCFQITR